MLAEAVGEHQALSAEIYTALKPLAQMAENLVAELKPKVDRLALVNVKFADAHFHLNEHAAPQSLTVGFEAVPTGVRVTEAERVIALALGILKRGDLQEVKEALLMVAATNARLHAQAWSANYVPPAQQVAPTPGQSVDDFLADFLNGPESSAETTSLLDDVLKEQGNG